MAGAVSAWLEAKMLDFQRISVLGGCLGVALAMFVAKCLEIEVPIFILLIVLRAGVPDYGVEWEIPITCSLNSCPGARPGHGLF